MRFFKLWYFLAIGFGLGTISFHLIPVGTIASFMAIPVWWLLIYFFSYKVYFLFLYVAIIIGIYSCGKINKIMGVHDHKSIVWDEFIGMWITLIVVPIHDYIWVVVAFLVFRILDILKPWPISWLDRVIKGGLGIVIDDVTAGMISICILLFLMRVFV